MESPYMLVEAGTVGFWLSVEQIERVRDFQILDEGMVPVYAMDQLCGSGFGGNPYILILHVENERFGIAVEKVEGIHSIRQEEIYPLPRLVKNHENQYLHGIVWDMANGRRSGYLLSVPMFLERSKKWQPVGWLDN
ncbi:MAG: chemotaxis protein CheW [Blautia sp.]